MNRTNPYEMMEKFFERMNDEFDEFGRPSRGMLATGIRDTLTVDVADREESFEVTVDVPGFDRDEIDVRVDNHTLTVAAEHEQESTEGEESFIHRERSHRTLTRSLELPAEIDEEAVEATLTNGVLTVTLPKVEADESQAVSVDID
jgi:HSP20 family protein